MARQARAPFQSVLRAASLARFVICACERSCQRVLAACRRNLTDIVGVMLLSSSSISSRFALVSDCTNRSLIIQRSCGSVAFCCRGASVRYYRGISMSCMSIVGAEARCAEDCLRMVRNSKQKICASPDHRSFCHGNWLLLQHVALGMADGQR